MRASGWSGDTARLTPPSASPTAPSASTPWRLVRAVASDLLRPPAHDTRVTRTSPRRSIEPPAHAPLGRAPSERAHASRSARRRVSQRGALLPHARRCRKDPRRVGAGQRRASVAKVRGRRWPRHEPVRPDAEAVLPVFCFGGAWLVQCHWLVSIHHPASRLKRQVSSDVMSTIYCPCLTPAAVGVH